MGRRLTRCRCWGRARDVRRPDQREFISAAGQLDRYGHDADGAAVAHLLRADDFITTKDGETRHSPGLARLEHVPFQDCVQHAEVN